MLIHELARGGAILAKWPTLVDQEKIPKPLLQESETCKKQCAITPACLDDGSVGEHTCAHGLTYINHKLHDSTIKIFGVRGENNKTKLNIYTSRGLKGRHVSSVDIESWLRSIENMLEIIDQDFMARQSEMLDPLHDPMRIAKQISTIANRLVQNEQRGRTFDEQLNNSNIELKTLVKAAGFLADSFELLTIFFNPEAATFGGKTSISLHGLLMKLVSIFRIDDNGLTKSSTKIYLDGTCHRNIFAYDSFKLIPFALISNAVKYSLEGNINVRIEDRRNTIEISVESIGPLIEADELSKIFERRGRGRWAKKISDGKGVGLYLSKIIANAHGFEIKVTSRRTGEVRDSIPLAHNRFYFEVPSTAQ